ncbi:hypothetical protein, partial [Staphylococcus felis]|uniref:hypothetical protein n=1 Tax=Staphylococcus felis TaxID=46127 RepID=UPI001EE83508
SEQNCFLILLSYGVLSKILLLGHRLSLPTRQVQELAPKNFVKLCSSVEKSAIETLFIKVVEDV